MLRPVEADAAVGRGRRSAGAVGSALELDPNHPHALYVAA
jgi:hypothetical protein